MSAFGKPDFVCVQKWAMPVIGEPMRCTKYDGQKWVTTPVVAMTVWDRQHTYSVYGSGFEEGYILNADVPSNMVSVTTQSGTHYLVHVGVRSI